MISRSGLIGNKLSRTSGRRDSTETVLSASAPAAGRRLRGLLTRSARRGGSRGINRSLPEL